MATQGQINTVLLKSTIDALVGIYGPGTVGVQDVVLSAEMQILPDHATREHLTELYYSVRRPHLLDLRKSKF
jgi:hypothetical protein